MCHRHPGREAHIRCQRCERPICPDCMLPAAVGFQCPSCVKEGAKSTRAGRTAYGGARVADPTLTSKVLIGINVLVWLLLTATGGNASDWLYRLALIPVGRCVQGAGWFPSVGSEQICSTVAPAQWFPGVGDGAFWQLLTTMFTHVDLIHIGFNMLALWVLGPQLELALGRIRFLALYLLSGLAGSALVFWSAAAGVPTIGASGAVFGLMGALLILAIKVRGNVQNLLFWIGINAAITVVGRGFISWQAHLGGFLGGLALMAIFVFSPKGPQRARWQLAGVAAYAVVVVAAIAARSLALA
ncbi:rhomboid family intramembrane serine protease [Nocardioides cavernaquae]|uniref:rhomboid family intramembrane serine protease n=1 Tax=Nocardioides cavernaquae TaxID=2321396 RepID=UPI001EE5DF76|nr:rhomboid family intramembrane serine protease [Nocardioides cavernaquae]